MNWPQWSRELAGLSTVSDTPGSPGVDGPGTGVPAGALPLARFSAAPTATQRKTNAGWLAKLLRFG